MAYEHITCTFSDGVATLTLNRPEVLNSFNRAMANELQDALRSAAEDPTVRAILLTGSGRAFCAGQDLGEAMPADGEPLPDLGDIVRHSYSPLVRLVRTVEKPVVCAVNGIAAGAGANLALACDILVAAEEASFIQSFSKIGLIPDTGGTFFLPRIVGLHRAAAMMMLGDRLPAVQAKELGIVHEVVPQSTLLEAALALNRSLENDLAAQLDVEEELQRQAGSTRDYREGVMAFLEKRSPTFTGE